MTSGSNEFHKKFSLTMLAAGSIAWLVGYGIMPLVIGAVISAGFHAIVRMAIES